MVANTRPPPDVGNIARKIDVSPWQEWFAWRPVKVNGKRVWLKRVFRRCVNTYVDHDDWKRYEYGTAFDAIRNEPTTYVGQVPPKPAAPFKGLQDG